VHGITGSAMSYGAVARHLPAGATMLAPDLRGRGHSAGAAGSGGLAGHARDVVALAEKAGAPVVLLGHSMGAYIALLAAVDRPDLFSRLVMVDGGLPLPSPPPDQVDAALAAGLGPALARLSRVFDSVDAYVEFFREHPAMGPHWNADLEDYVRYDAVRLDAPPDGAPPDAAPPDAAAGDAAGHAAGPVRSRVREQAALVDGRDLMTGADRVAAALRALTVPALLLHAPDGMFGAPPGFMPPELVRRWTDELPVLEAELVPDCNHYTILLGDRAEVVAARVAGG
jgi:lipase